MNNANSKEQRNNNNNSNIREEDQRRESNENEETSKFNINTAMNNNETFSSEYESPLQSYGHIEMENYQQPNNIVIQ